MDITELEKRIEDIVSRKDVEKISKDLTELEKQSQENDFWDDSSRAQVIMQEISHKREELELVSTLRDEINYFRELSGLNDPSLSKELEGGLVKLSDKIGKLELEFFLGGQYDKNDAIFSIHAGQGGTEACDWADILSRMYLRFFEKKGWKVDIVDKISGNEAGITTISMIVKGKYAYGYLKREKGAHRLVRMSPFNSQGLRQTSFAGVEVSPVIEETDLVINEEEVQFVAVRSGGKGGQNVNKVSSAVRLTHVPTGIVVSCSSQRSQLQNRQSAMQMLRSKLYALEDERRAKELAKEKGEHKEAGWGNQIRNYVLQPYRLVKDVRTGVETSDTDGVLAGNIDEFIEAAVKL